MLKYRISYKKSAAQNPFGFVLEDANTQHHEGIIKIVDFI